MTNAVVDVPIVLVGAGGHAKVIIELIRAVGGYSIVGCLDPQPLGSHVLDVPIIGGDELLPRLAAEGVQAAAITVGSNALRERLGRRALTHGLMLPSLISPRAYVSASSAVGCGTAILPSSVIHPDVSIGQFCIINTGAIVEHDCILADAVHIAPGSVLCGGVIVGTRTFICAGSTAIPGVRIAPDTTVGAGAVIIRDLNEPGLYIGSPAVLRQAR
jgi:UDP-perosamine 4-acetyltransferase